MCSSLDLSDHLRSPRFINIYSWFTESIHTAGKIETLGEFPGKIPKTQLHSWFSFTSHASVTLGSPELVVQEVLP